jgi:hypothetical protein
MKTKVEKVLDSPIGIVTSAAVTFTLIAAAFVVATSIVREIYKDKAP